ncbi:MAG: signal recognition particle-docking protein FtsY [Armatimonadota bacterium]|nr:signal recognition particle-docking protein FtsY [Armatimonadota bacterium]MDR7451805.1 signal recognition particle-docking protein FtsY [Armatimonadota bacterium]MDR7467430.1 signal recognition particle-docking protein FtsY [Armatimonadota bacterium]MDR7494200.1 signal recognition particle-docking protein FtsY [Armatimonadota bacterium]MDR7498834.1 signal recognition particle-docking protein FtsY [Armatimonadota bacterium]
MNLFDRLRAGLARTRETFTARIEQALRQPPGPEVYQALEAALIEGDVGVPTTTYILDRLRARREARDPATIRRALREIMQELLGPPSGLRLEPSPAVLLVLGVNGSGKTTSIGKLACRLRAEGKSVLLAAADTFRAAAIDQLVVWGRRAGADVIRHAPGADPAAVVYDAARAVRSRGMDVLIVDTAGRLHTKVNLMEELKKIARVLGRELPDVAVERLLVLDASTGQNAIQQARLFHQAVTVTGIILAKLDGTAKGGAVLAIGRELGLPVKFVGTGEGPEDLQPFDPQAYLDALLPGGAPAI